MKPISDKLRDFTGQNIYVGMDVHNKSWKVHIYSDEFELKSFSQQPDVDLLYNYLQKNYKNANYQVAYEAGFCGFWIQRSLASKGVNCMVVNPADIPTSSKEKLHKTDLVDSRKIAKGLKSGELNCIHIPDIELELDRQLLRNRERLIKDNTRCKNRIKASSPQCLLVPCFVPGKGNCGSVSLPDSEEMTPEKVICKECCMQTFVLNK